TLGARAGKDEYFVDDGVDVDRGELRWTATRDVAQTLHDRGRTGSFGDDVIQRLAGLRKVRWHVRQPSQASLGNGRDGGEWLVELVHDGAGQLSQRRQAIRGRELRLQIAQRRLRGLAIGDVGQDAVVGQVAIVLGIDLAVA